MWGGVLPPYELNTQWNHLVKYFLFSFPTWKLLSVWQTPESHIVFILASHVNLRACDGLATCPGCFPAFCPVHAGTGSNPHLSMTLNGIKRAEQKGRMNVSFNVVNLYFAINWPADRFNNWAGSTETTVSGSLCLCEAPLKQSGYESYYLHSPWGSRDPIAGNTKWQEIISVYSGVDGKSHNRYILDHKVRMVSLWSCLVIGPQ